MKFGDQVRKLRTEQGLSLRKFAYNVGISPTYLSKIERNDFSPPSEMIIKLIAMELECDSDELLALAGKVSSDLISIILNNPQLARKKLVS
jgi:transcriptional regulator with XRE-family HTH domain